MAAQHYPLPPAKVQAYADTNGLPPAAAHPASVPRPHRIMVNVDAETAEALRSLAFVAGMSRSAVAADALRMLLPTIAPVLQAIGKARTEPHEALAKLAELAKFSADQAELMLEDIRLERQKLPPSSNTGG